jgi:hypothetical protein
VTSELDDRRQRAREAGWDATVGWSQESTSAAIEAVIETATRVQITPEIMRAAERENAYGPVSIKAVVATFEAAGFEVVE